MWIFFYGEGKTKIQSCSIQKTSQEKSKTFLGKHTHTVIYVVCDIYSCEDSSDQDYLECFKPLTTERAIKERFKRQALVGYKLDR